MCENTRYSKALKNLVCIDMDKPSLSIGYSFVILKKLS